jgi:hypothetical protein
VKKPQRSGDVGLPGRLAAVVTQSGRLDRPVPARPSSLSNCARSPNRLGMAGISAFGDLPRPTLIYRRTGNVPAVQLLFGHTKIESWIFKGWPSPKVP